MAPSCTGTRALMIESFVIPLPGETGAATAVGLVAYYGGKAAAEAIAR